MLRYPDGSTAGITYATTGAAGFPKETLDLVADGKVLRLDDFVRAAVHGRKRLGQLAAAARPGTRASPPSWTRSSTPCGPAGRCRCRWTRWSPPRAATLAVTPAWPRGPRSGATAGRSGSDRPMERGLVPAAVVPDGTAGGRRPGGRRGAQEAVAVGAAGQPERERRPVHPRTARRAIAAVPPDASETSASPRRTG